MEPGHRTDFSERGQQVMNNTFKDIADFTKEPDIKSFLESQHLLFNASTLVYLTLPKGHIKYSILDIGGLGMSIILAAKASGVDSLIAYE